MLSAAIVNFELVWTFEPDPHVMVYISIVTSQLQRQQCFTLCDKFTFNPILKSSLPQVTFQTFHSILVEVYLYHNLKTNIKLKHLCNPQPPGSAVCLLWRAVATPNNLQAPHEHTFPIDVRSGLALPLPCFLEYKLESMQLAISQAGSYTGLLTSESARHGQVS